MKYLVLVFIAIFLAGCAVELSPEAQRVAIMSEKPQDCKALGAVDASIVDTSRAMSDNAMRKRAEDGLKILSAKLGGDAVHILGAKKRWDYLLSGYEYQIKGEAYKCAESAIKNAESNADSALDSAKNVDFGVDSANHLK